MEDSSKQASDLVSILANWDLRFISSRDLATEAEHCRREQAELRARDETGTQYSEYLIHRLVKITDEMKRRQRLVRYGGPRLSRQGWVDPNLLAEVKSRIDLCELVGHYCPAIPGRSRWRYACPIHGDGTDRNPSGVVYPDQQKWHCFVCNSGGDAFDFLMAFERVSFREAVVRLASMAGIELPQSNSAALGIYRHHEGGQHRARGSYKVWHVEVNL